VEKENQRFPGFSGFAGSGQIYGFSSPLSAMPSCIQLLKTALRFWPVTNSKMRSISSNYALSGIHPRGNRVFTRFTFGDLPTRLCPAELTGSSGSSGSVAAN